MTETLFNHEEIVSIWIERSPSTLNIPPSCFIHMDGRFSYWDPSNKMLAARFPIKTEFQNPRGYMQGGFVVAAIDNTLGPLSYLSGIPSVTMQLNTSYIRPCASHYSYIEVITTLVEQTSSKVYSSAEARSPEGKLLLTAQATSHIL